MHTSLRHLIRNITIWKVSILGFVWVYRTLAYPRPRVRIVVFHDVPDPEWFESMLRTLDESFHIITPSEFNAKTFSREKINVLVTFDDGYASWQHVALPTLESHNVRALFFINSGLIDRATDEPQADAFMADQLKIRPRAPLSWAGVHEIVSRGHTIGGHTRMHHDLTTLTPDALAEEIVADKETLERRLGLHVTDLAYPFGTKRHVNEVVVRAAERAGYLRGYTAVSRFVPKGETFQIPRMCIETGLSPRSLKRWIRGGYDLFDMMKSLCVR